PLFTARPNRLRHPPPSTLLPYTTLFRSSPPRTVLRDGHRGRDDAHRAALPRGTSELVQPRLQRGHIRALHRCRGDGVPAHRGSQDRKSTRLNSSHVSISYAVFCLKKKIE